MTRSPVLVDEARVCIYCRGDSTDSRSQAHVFPEALARNRMTLPPGAECDACNRANGRLDAELQHHCRIGTVIIHRGIPGKNGPRGRIGILERSRETGDVRVHGRALSAHLAADHLEIRLPEIASLDDARFRRALHHIGLNHLALVAGASVALDTKYDAVRRYIRYGDRPWPYAQFMLADDAERAAHGCSYFRWEPGTVVQIRSFIDDF